MQETNKYEIFFDYHICFQKGAYLNNVILIDNVVFFQSNIIPDADWNFFRLRKRNCDVPKNIELIKNISTTLNRQPTLSVVKESDLYNKVNSAIDVMPEYEFWMYTRLDALSIINRPEIVDDIKITQNNPPNGDFLEVFGNLFKDENVNEHFRIYYNTALTKSVLRNDVSVNHIIAYKNNEPIACCSIYLKDNIMGLYNVGTCKIRWH